MEFISKKKYPQWYKYETNGPNDIKNSHAMSEDDDSWQWINWYFWQEPCPYKGGPHEKDNLSRNEIMVSAEKEWKSRYDKPLESDKYPEPQYTGRCYELLCEWIPQQHQIFGCQYELSDLSVIDLLRDVNDVFILVSGGDWLTGDCKSTDTKKIQKARASAKLVRSSFLKNVRTDEELINHSLTPNHRWDSYLNSSYFIYEKATPYDHMHQKWLVGIRYEKLKRKRKNGLRYREIRSLMYSSYNITHNAKSNIESALYFPSISTYMADSLFSDICSLTNKENARDLFDWCISKNTEESLDIFTQEAHRPFFLALFTRADKKAQFIQAVDNVNFESLFAHHTGWKLNEYAGPYPQILVLKELAGFNKVQLKDAGVNVYELKPLPIFGWNSKDYFLKKLSRAHKISSIFKFIRNSRPFEHDEDLHWYTV